MEQLVTVANVVARFLKWDVELQHAHTPSEYYKKLANAELAAEREKSRRVFVYPVFCKRASDYDAAEAQAVKDFKNNCVSYNGPGHERNFYDDAFGLHIFVVYCPRHHKRFSHTNGECCTWMLPRNRSKALFRDVVGARIDRAILWMRQFANNDAVAQLGLQINLSLARISCKYKRKEEHLCACTKRRSGCYVLYGQAHEKAEITQDLDRDFYVASLGQVD